jgi:hypothetical protein
VGGLAADRPIIVTLVLSLGLATLAVAGAEEATGTYLAAAGVPGLIVAVLGFITAPLALAAIAPKSRLLRAALVFLVAALFAALEYAAPGSAVIPPAPYLLIGAPVVAFLAFFLWAGPAFGALTRFAFLATIAAALGMAGGLGLMAMQGIEAAPAGAFATLAFALGAAVAVGTAADFAALFARGADGRRAAGIAARYGAAPALFATLLMASAGGLVGFEAGDPDGALTLAWVAGAGALLAVLMGLFATAGALSLRRASETIAVRENRRREAFRRFWRPARQAASASAAMAFVAMLGIAAVAAAFNLRNGIPVYELVYLAAVSFAGGLVFLSAPAGLFLLIILMTGEIISAWAWQATGAAALSPAEHAVIIALVAALYAQFAVAWRNASSPRLNARETTEAAMSEGISSYAVSAAVGLAAFIAASTAGVWPGGSTAALLLALLALFGLVAAPAVMTALTHGARRSLG